MLCNVATYVALWVKGIHTVLFFACVFFAGQRQGNHRFHLVINTILFVLGTLGLILDSISVGLIFAGLDPVSVYKVNVLG